MRWRRLARAWRLRLSGRTFGDISRELGVDQRKACALVSGRNLRPYLAQMYLNREMLPRPRDGWKWVLQCTPKPTRPYPKAVAVPEKIQGYSDIVDFLAQFPPLPPDDPSLRFFGLSSEWFENNRTRVFGFLLGFLVGDAGKYYPDYEPQRHSNMISLRTNMSSNTTNERIMRFVRIPLAMLGLWSHPIASTKSILSWTTNRSDPITWALTACIGLKRGWRTSRNPLDMNWLLRCPRDFVVSFIQGLSESDGYIHNTGYYVGIASKPNSTFLCKLPRSIDINARTHPKHEPHEVRMSLAEAIKVPFLQPNHQWLQTTTVSHACSKSENSSSLPLFSFCIISKRDIGLLAPLLGDLPIMIALR